MHIVLALRRRVRLFGLGAREGFEKKHAKLAAMPEGSKFLAGAVTNRKIKECPGLEKSLSKKNLQFKKYNFSPPAPNCTFDSSGARRVRVFCTSSVPCDAGFDFFGSECAKGSRNKHLELAAAPEGSEFRSLNERKTREFPRFFDIGIIECAEGSIFSGRYTPKNLNHPAKAPPRPRPPRRGGGRREQRRIQILKEGLLLVYARDSRPC